MPEMIVVRAGAQTGAVELARRLAARYWDLGERGRTDDLAELIAEPIVRVAIHPEKVARFVMP